MDKIRAGREGRNFSRDVLYRYNYIMPHHNNFVYDFKKNIDVGLIIIA
jgi:hypothetical protein